MKTLGIVCEYNPFHNGHKYHIAESKRLLGCDTAVCAMSGSLVQRGEIAVFDKWTRAKNAVENGADLVLEIPAFFCLQSGEKYAYGAVSVLNLLGNVDYLSFGSECGDIDFLQKIAEIKRKKSFNDTVKTLMQSGMSYPSATEKAIGKFLDNSFGERIFSPNDLLGVEYISAVYKTKSKVRPVTVKRHLTEHSGGKPVGNFASASEIRKMIFEGADFDKFLPYSAKNYEIFDENNAESLILGYFRLKCAEKNILGGETGMANRLIKSAKISNSLDEFYSNATSKRYTESRIKRMSKCAFFDVKKNSVLDYIRPLAMNERGRKLLKNSPGKNLIVTKTADFNGSKNSMFKYDILATDFAYLCANDKTKRMSGADFYTPPVYIKN